MLAGMGPDDCSVLSSVVITTSSINHSKHDFVDRCGSKPLFLDVDFKTFLTFRISLSETKLF